MKATRRFRWSVIAAVLMFPFAGHAGNLVIRPTTTLSEQTSNNTSAADSFATQSNGNLGAGNVSKGDIHSLLYPAARTKVFAHLMLWFGKPDHINVGYSSTDPVQVKRQISDMISRGIDGVVMVWYGPNNAIDRAAKLVMQEAESHPGFTFAIMVDNGAIRWNSCAGCDPQSALVNTLQYVEQTYFPSPAYLRIDGRPVVTNFDIDKYYKVDWSAAKGALATDPLFLFQNSDGFSHVQSEGAYSWDAATSSDFGMSYLAKFYGTGMASQGKQTWGAAYKGFNDKLASWGMNRVMAQQCGQTWLQTFAKINSMFNSSNQLPAMQLVTWNDYEEGTEIESGIDNCVDVSAAVAASSLQWKITGNENTIDHYTVYVSADGRNLMSLGDQAIGSRTLDMCGYALPAANYTLFVQAVGKPNLSNQMSAGVRYTPHCSAPVTTASNPPATTPAKTPSAPVTSPTAPAAPPVSSPTTSPTTPVAGPTAPPVVPPTSPAPTAPSAPVANPTIALSASPSAVTIIDGQSGSPNITVTAHSGFASPIALSCSNLPAGMSCAFSPAIITPGAKAASSVLKVSVTRAPHRPGNPPKRPPKSGPLGFGFGVAGLLVLGQLERKRILRGLVLCGLFGAALLLSSCGAMPGASSDSSAGVAPGAYRITVNATSSATRASTAAMVTIR